MGLSFTGTVLGIGADVWNMKAMRPASWNIPAGF